MRKLALSLIFLAGALLLLRCGAEPTPRALLAEHCSSCHLAPAPASLPKEVWEHNILPEMGARMGIKSMTYDPATKLGETEYQLARDHGIYPETPTISQADWERLSAYILDQAPDSLRAPSLPDLDDLPGFTPHSISAEGKLGSLVTYLGREENGLVIGDGYGNSSAWMHDEISIISTSRAPVVHRQPTAAGTMLLTIGNIYPTEASNGKLSLLHADGQTVIADSLHRPVYFLAVDLDDDGDEEIIVCEYGNFTGALTLLERMPSGAYRRSRLSGVAGSTRVVAEDLNADGRRDLVFLHAQGDEGIDVLYQQENGQFERESLLRFSPVWGTSWFELLDFDGDGDLDILTAHGDNADYSNILKPYHGLRIYTNDGRNRFSEAYFLPLPGATRLVARDFDHDGDTDVAVASNFADFRGHPGASFVYLENEGNPDSPTFTHRTTPLALNGRWLILEANDYDRDGDDDIVLGSFTLNPSSVPDTVERRWRDSDTDVLLLENRLQ